MTALYELCWVTPPGRPLGPACDRARDHGGPHTWEVISDAGGDPGECQHSTCDLPADVEIEVAARGGPPAGLMRQRVCVDHAASVYFPTIARTVRAAGPYLLRVAYLPRQGSGG